MTGKINLASHALPIIIEDGAWICARATINPGVRIGKGSMVAGGAVVTKNVGGRVLVGGVPARISRNLGMDEGLDGEGTWGGDFGEIQREFRGDSWLMGLD